MTDNTQQHGDEQSALSPRERILRGLQAMAAALNAADAWTDEARAGYRAASATQYPQAVAPAGASTPKRCTECHHVFTAADLAAEDPQVWGHPCYADGQRIKKGVTPCESFREPIEEAGAGAPTDALTELQQRIDALEHEIAEAREACLIVRRQDYFDASLLTAVNHTVSQLFQMQSRAEAAERARDEARREAERQEGHRFRLAGECSAAEATIATLGTLVDEFETAFANALDTVSDTVIFAQCTVPKFVKAVTAALTGDPAGPSQPAKRHYVGGSATRTACGRQRNKLPRGGSAYEWNYVTCHDCLATRPAPFTLDEPARTVPPAPATEDEPYELDRHAKETPRLLRQLSQVIGARDLYFSDDSGWTQVFTAPERKRIARTLNDLAVAARGAVPEARPPQEIEKEIAALDAAGKARIAQIIDGIIPDVDSREHEELASAIAVHISDLAEENEALRDNNRAVKAMSDERARAAAQAPQDELLHPAHQVYFRAGLIACREYMARFVEAQDPAIAHSIRANWWPALGPDFGPPRKLDWGEVTSGEYGTPTFRVKSAEEVSPTLEALPLAAAFLNQPYKGEAASAPAPQDPKS